MNICEPAAIESILAIGRADVLLLRLRAGQEVDPAGVRKGGPPGVREPFQLREGGDEPLKPGEFGLLECSPDFEDDFVLVVRSLDPGTL
jgi:hypothetical protein